MWLQVAPDPNLRIQQKFHLDLRVFFGFSATGACAASHSDPGAFKEIMLGRGSGTAEILGDIVGPTGGGVTSAMGWPKRVTRMGSLVLRTLSQEPPGKWP
jgi:hypothetical protein